MIGKKISQYVILDKIGEGGMGQVYSARDTLLERTVVLKVLPPEIAKDPDRKRRFLREARAASALNHPGIITIHNVIREEDLDCIVMELVAGQPLSEVIPPEGLPVERALAIVIRVAAAVGAAHQAGVVHRDLKPANVMVTAGDRVKVLDFGLAKHDAFVDPDAPTQIEQAPLTRMGTVLGTLDYMSPEQALGQPADARSDVFSLGAVLYEMLTGQRPFRSSSPVSLLHEVAYTEARDVGELRSDLPEPLGPMVARALEKDPADRFQSMAELAEALQSVLDGRAVVAERPASPPPRPGRSLPSRRVILVASIALALALTAAWLVPLIREGPAARPAKEPPGETAAIAEPDPADLEPFALLQRGVRLLDRFDKPGYVDQAIASFRMAVDKDLEYAPGYAGLASALWYKFRIEQDEIFLQQAMQNVDRALELDPQLTRAQVARANIRTSMGELEEAQELFRQILLVDPANADAHVGLGHARKAADDLAGAEESYRKALELTPEDPEVHLLLGALGYRQGDYEGAESFHARAVELAPDFYLGYRSLAAALHMQGKFAEAATALQRALEINPSWEVYSNLGTLYFYQGLYTQAVASFEKALEGGANNHRSWANLADAYRWTPGKEEAANEAYTRAVQLTRERLAENPESSSLRSRLALYLAKRGDARAAIEELEGIAKLETSDLSVLYRAVVVCELAGQRQRSLELLELALSRGFSLEEVKADPELSDLRADPEYHRLLMRRGLP